MPRERAARQAAGRIVAIEHEDVAHAGELESAVAAFKLGEDVPELREPKVTTDTEP